MAFHKVNTNFILRLGKDAVVKHTQSGAALTELGGYMSGGKENSDFWVNVTVWGKPGESVANLAKGSKVLIIGTLNQPTAYSRQDGGAGINMSVTAIGWPEKVEWTEVDGADDDDFDADYDDDEVPF